MSRSDQGRRRRVGVVTSSRADFGLWRPVLRTIEQQPRLDLCVYVTGTHLSDAHGSTISEIEEAGVPIAARVPIALDDDSPAGVTRAMAETTAGFGAVFAEGTPDLLMVLGDRFEMFAAVSAAVPFRLPIGHVHGGEVTVGAMDEAFRHSITKMSHLHFATTEEYRRRIIQLGESPDRVFMCGAPGLDNIAQIDPMSDEELDAKLGIEIADHEPLLVTYHPVTLEADSARRDIGQLLDALAAVRFPIVFTAPNADTDNGVIRQSIERFVADHRDTVLVESLGTRAYFAMMKRAAAMVGNSSSGIIEAASFGLPVVNIGNRQAGRVRGPNVLDVPCLATDIFSAIARATSPGFRVTLAGNPNPYGDGQAARRIVDVIASVDLGPELLLKSFHDIEVS